MLCFPLENYVSARLLSRKLCIYLCILSGKLCICYAFLSIMFKADSDITFKLSLHIYATEEGYHG